MVGLKDSNYKTLFKSIAQTIAANVTVSSDNEITISEDHVAQSITHIDEQLQLQCLEQKDYVTLDRINGLLKMLNELFNPTTVAPQNDTSLSWLSNPG